MLILLLILILGALPFPALSAPAPSNLATDFLAASRPEMRKYKDVLASGEQIFSPSSADIVLTTEETAISDERALASKFSPSQSSTNRVNAAFAGTRCETTPFSPYFLDANNIVVKLFSLGNQWCCQINPGDRCTRMGIYMTAEVNICGKFNDCIKCGFAALGADEVIRGCRKSYGLPVDRAGGKFGWSQYVEIFVGHAYKGLGN